MRLIHIDSLRGIAAMAVVYLHYSYLFTDTAASGEYGYLGVHIFFIISGFILPYSCHTSGYNLANTGRFILKRIIRLDPPYLTAAILAMVLPILNGRDLLSYKAMAAHLVYLNDILKLPWASGVFWTLALEFQFYLFVAISFKGYTTKSHAWSVLFIAATITSSFLFTNKIFLPAWMVFFSTGALLFRRLILGLPLIYFLPGILIALASVAFLFGIAPAAAALFSTLYILFVRLKLTRGTDKLLIGLGIISYSLYLTHIEISKVARRLTELSPYLVSHSFLRVFTCILMAIAFAIIFYYLFERPFKKLSGRIKYYKQIKEPNISALGMNNDFKL